MFQMILMSSLCSPFMYSLSWKKERNNTDKKLVITEDALVKMQIPWLATEKSFLFYRSNQTRRTVFVPNLPRNKKYSSSLRNKFLVHKNYDEHHFVLDFVKCTFVDLGSSVPNYAELCCFVEDS